MVGSLMARSLTELKWDKVSHAVSGFLTVMVMPLTYSIAYGLIAGIMVFAVMESVFWILSFAGIEVPGDEPDNHMLIEEPAEGEAAEKEDVENFAEKKKEKAENSAQDEPEFAESGNKNVGGES
jgi:xanthine/uracil/vitamin C permease (AzgA family)